MGLEPQTPPGIMEAVHEASEKLKKLASKKYLPKTFWHGLDAERISVTKSACATALALYALSGPISKGLEEVAHRLPEEIKDSLGRQEIDRKRWNIITTESQYIADAVASFFIPPVGADRRRVPQHILIAWFGGQIQDWVESRSIFPWLRVLQLTRCHELENGGYDVSYSVDLVGRNYVFYKRADDPLIRPNPDVIRGQNSTVA